MSVSLDCEATLLLPARLAAIRRFRASSRILAASLAFADRAAAAAALPGEASGFVLDIFGWAPPG